MKHVPETFQTMVAIARNISKQEEMKTNYQRAFSIDGIKRILTGLPWRRA